MDKTSFLKNKRLVIILSVAVLFVASSAYGIVKVKNNIAKQQKRIFDLEEFQKLELEEKNKQQENEAKQQNDELDSLKKNQEIASCQKKKEDCAKKIYELENGELDIYRSGHLLKGDRTKMIQQLKDDIAGWEKNKKETADEQYEKYFQDGIDKTEKEIKKIKEIMASEMIIKGDLLAGECKDYQSPCE